MKSSVIAFEREMEKEYYAAGSLCCCFLKQANVLTIHLRLYDYFYNSTFLSKQLHLESCLPLNPLLLIYTTY